MLHRSVVVVLFGVLFPGCRCAGEERRPVTPPKVILIGLDGAAWEQIDPLIAAGKLPTLASLIEGGVRGRLRSTLPSRSPILWTTIATGKGADEHGITDFFTVKDDGTKLAFESSHVRVPRFWDILGQYGKRSSVIYWWLTWPASPMKGVLISDFLFYARSARWREQKVDDDSVRKRAVYPAELLDWVEKRLDGASTLSPDLVRQIADLPPDRLQHFVDELDPRFGLKGAGGPLAVLKNKLIESEFHRELGLELLAREDFDLYTYYSKGIDATGHVFWRHYEPDAPVWGKRPRVKPELRQVIPRFYEYEDRNLAEILRRTGAGPDTYVLVVSDHGHHAGGHEDGPDGIFILKGPGVRSGATVEGLSIFDVTPTLLYLFDVPAGEDMTGKVPGQVFTPEHFAAHPPELVPSHRFEGGGPAPAAGLEVPERLREELEALGYVE